VATQVTRYRLRPMPLASRLRLRACDQALAAARPVSTGPQSQHHVHNEFIFNPRGWLRKLG
jgi:hypothetical protein